MSWSRSRNRTALPQVVFLGLLLVIGGCGSKPVATRYYLLTDPAPASRTESAPVALELGDVSLPVYLQSRNMAVISGSAEVRTARGHRWSEPLSEGVRRYLDDAFSSVAQGETPYMLDVAIRHLHGSEAGLVYLDLDWKIRERGSDVVQRSGRFSQTLAQSAPGYEALVFAHRDLLDQFVRFVSGEAGGLANQKQAAPTSDAAAISEKPSS